MKLQTGDPAPDFEYIDREGNKKHFHDIKGTKIVFFFPKAFTTGCTKESCSIRDNYADLKQKGVSEVIGISTDSHAKQQEFAKEYGLNFILAEDKSKKISKAYGVLIHALIVNIAKRYTFVVDGDNKIVSATNIGMGGANTKYGLKDYGKELLELNF